MLLDLNEHSKTTGVTMNFRKTKIMCNRITEPFILDKTEIQLVDKYIYLGQMVTLYDKMFKEIKRRASQAWRAFWEVRFILMDKSLNRKIILGALDTCIVPVLLYDTHTWSLTNKHKNTIEVCQRKMVSNMLGVSTRHRISKNGPC